MTTSIEIGHYWSMSASDYRLSSIRSSLVHVCLDNSNSQAGFSLSLDLKSTLTGFLYLSPGTATITEALTCPTKYLMDGTILPPYLPEFLDIADALDL